MSANTALELEDVVFRYQEKGKRNILDHTSLSIPAGTLTVLMGGSGCGKSTLAAVAAGLYPENGGFLEGGTIRLYGQDLKTLDPQKRAAYLTVLFQNPDLQFCMNTLREEMRFCLENICIPAGKMDERIEQAAAELGIVPLLDQPLSTLSGGEKQTTNNRMELTGVISALRALKEPCIVELYSDSKYVIDALSKGWAVSWRRNGWKKADKKPALNSDLWAELLELCDTHEVRCHWVKGHAENEFNNRCDELAVAASQTMSAR